MSEARKAAEELLRILFYDHNEEDVNRWAARIQQAIDAATGEKDKRIEELEELLGIQKKVYAELEQTSKDLKRKPSKERFIHRSLSGQGQDPPGTVAEMGGLPKGKPTVTLSNSELGICEDCAALRAEVNRLTHASRYETDIYNALLTERDALRAEVERLKALLRKIEPYLEPGGCGSQSRHGQENLWYEVKEIVGTGSVGQEQSARDADQKVAESNGKIAELKAAINLVLPELRCHNLACAIRGYHAADCKNYLAERLEGALAPKKED